MSETKFENVTELDAVNVNNGTEKLDEIKDEETPEIEAKRVEKKYTTSFKVESYFNTLVHILNGAVACFMTLYLIREVMNDWPGTNDTFPLHAFFTTVGYQLFMAEAILVFYAPNSWTYFLSHKTKKHLHWILQLIGAIFIIFGNVWISVIRTTPHFATVHSITGLISMILLGITMLQGVWAYFAFDLRAYMKPIQSKFLHNIHSLLCFVIGMISLIFGYRMGADHGTFDTIEMEYALITIAVVTTVFSVVGAVKSGLRYLNKIE
ncbi:cytochrome b561 domain-containing protein 2-like [Bradysia coprophila]|uniref:cytochrome b561 domain-containing protein 2-like n=1 Tax=Bradysia coprophila TaxID=38358 RepID=UPI00187DD00C|nr:cytochrome b561 domain-containing protein 2-like [Bradysia coprophila]